MGEAEDRTALAGDRTTLANERTLAAWWRTAMAGLAAAVAFAKLFGDVQPQWLVRGGASLLVAFSLLVLGMALRRYLRVARAVDRENVDRLPTLTLSIATGLLTLAALVGGVALWLF